MAEASGGFCPPQRLVEVSEFRGVLDVEALERCLFEPVDRCHLNGDLQAAQVQMVLDEDERAFLARLCPAGQLTLEGGALWHFRLLSLAADRWLLAVTFHHIVSDRSTVIQFHHELNLLYPHFARGQPSPLPPASWQYDDYAAQRCSIRPRERSWLRRTPARSKRSVPDHDASSRRENKPTEVIEEAMSSLSGRAASRSQSTRGGYVGMERFSRLHR